MFCTTLSLHVSLSLSLSHCISLDIICERARTLRISASAPTPTHQWLGTTFSSVLFDLSEHLPSSRLERIRPSSLFVSNQDANVPPNENKKDSIWEVDRSVIARSTCFSFPLPVTTWRSECAVWFEFFSLDGAGGATAFWYQHRAAAKKQIGNALGSHSAPSAGW